MEPWLLLALSLLCLEPSGAETPDHRGLAAHAPGKTRGPAGPEFNQPQGGQPGRVKRRKAAGPGRGRTRVNRERSQPPLALTRLGSIPASAGGNDGMSVFIESYRGVDERQSNYNVLPDKKGQCVYQGLTMFEQAVWSPKPCVTCLCSRGRVVCDEVTCPALPCHFPYTPPGQCCPICTDRVARGDVPDFSGDSPVPNDPSAPDPMNPDPILDPVVPRTQTEIEHLLKREEQLHRQEEERLLKKDEEKKRRRKQKKEEAEKKRRLQEEKMREEERLRVEEEEGRRQAEANRLREEAEKERLRVEEEEGRRQAEANRLREEAQAAMRDHERRQAEERRRHEEELKEKIRELAELEEEQREEEVEWLLRGDVFQMFPEGPTEEGILPPAPPLAPPTERRTEVIQQPGMGLPPGCGMSDVTVTCENARLTNFPPLNIPELKSLSLEGNDITTLPMGAFNGIPNLEWINLGKNKLTTAGLDPQAFRGLKFLSRLYLDNNFLELVPTDLPPTLQELKINENHLRGIDENSFEGLSDLLTLELEGNVLSEGNLDPRAFSPLSQLSYLRLGRNHFRTVPQGLPPSLLEVYLENNLIEEISDSVFNQTTNLNMISLRHNRLDESRIAPLAWINLKYLESIDLSYNRLYLVPSYLPRALVHLVLVGNQIERIPGFVFAHMEPGLEYLYLSFNRLDGEGVEPESFFGTYTSMTELCLDNNQLVTVPAGINEMSSLHFLRLNNNRIRTFAEDAICDPHNNEDSHIVTLRLENNYIDTRKIVPNAFSCVRSYSSVVLKPQWAK
ncbi:extracellular matrix protein 2 isoform X3 [Esox lucius]|uniref:extracellular matrix protein 2 isoform X3 n=1 Tax=Esox lucius TaxID=8010 RepID=UPI001476A4E3|nr:extracellular matrix protein 2 isoform X3 [Esox lucius]XP_019909110.2 extracellular matrix protein 2 isoform X3 [Esox lucius]XP_034152043.1 extracellular matrix protein 2 isoform X3 [Esox lucius]